MPFDHCAPYPFLRGARRGCFHTPGMALTLSLVATLTFAGDTDFAVTDTMTAADFNGASLGEDGFGVLVGDGGTIVHREDGAVTVMDSGTDADLFDVFVVDAALAVATGQGVVLRWDGEAWTTIVEDPEEPTFTSVWVSPQRDVAVYNIPGSITLHRAHDLINDQPSRLSAASGFDIAYCGASNDIKAIIRNGSIQAFDNNLLPTPGSEDTFGTLFDNSTQPLNLTAAWFPPDACLDGPTRPLAAVGIHNSRFFHHFDHEQGWQPMPVEGGAVPGDQTLTWLAGVGPGLIYAVGFRPAAGGGFEGVIWRWDGQLWRQLALPPDVPGLTDLAVSFRFLLTVFQHGFEAAPLVKMGRLGSATEIDLFAAAESGRALNFRDAARVLGRVVDLEVIEKRLLTPPPFVTGTELTYEFSVRNNGPEATNVSIAEYVTMTQRDTGFIAFGAQFVSSNCALMEASYNSSLAFRGIMLDAGEILHCEVTWRIEDGDFESIRNYVIVDPIIVDGAADTFRRNNSKSVVTAIE